MDDILKFDFSEILSFLKKDLQHPTYQGYLGGRFPVRIMYTDDYYTYVQILKTILENFNPLLVPLSEYCIKDDVLPNINEMIRDVRDGLMKENLMVLTSLGEVIRLNNKLYPPASILSSLHTIQIDPYAKGRLWVILFGVSPAVTEYWKTSQDPRKVPPIYIPSIAEEDITPKICVATSRELVAFSQKFSKNRVFIVHGYKEYLKLYEKPESLSSLISNKILLTGSRILSKYLQKGEFPGVKIVSVVTIKDIAKHILDLDIPFEYFESEFQYWEKLLEEFTKYENPSIEEYLKAKFNIQEFSYRHLLKLWKDSSEYEKWLIFNWMKLHKDSFENEYLKLVLSDDSVTYTSFENVIWTYPLEKELEFNIKLVKNRKEVILLMNLTTPMELYNILENAKDPLQKLSMLLGIKKEDKAHIILSVKEALKRSYPLTEIKNIVKITYPELYHYLSFVSLDDVPKSILEYFREYIIARTLNEPTSRLLELQRVINRNNLYVKFQHRNPIISNFNYPIVFIDGLGIEWAGLLKWYLKQSFPGYNITLIIGRASLPTTTEFNKLPRDSVIVSTIELDEVLHSKSYPHNIVEEIETIKSIINENLSKLQKIMFIVTSDHGATQFNGHLNAENRKINMPTPIEGETKREGRYFVTEGLPSELSLDNTVEYLVEVKEGKTYLVSRTYQIFPGGRVSNTETHGGATPEELLVPIIVVKPTEEISPDQVSIYVTQKVLKLIQPILKIKIESPIKIEEVKVQLGEDLISGRQVTSTLWEFDLRELKLKPGNYTATVLSGGKKLGSIEFKIKGGLEEEELI